MGSSCSERTGDDFSHGVAKLYRRECFEEIGGFVREVMWDGIDCHRCRMLGWEAVSDPDPRLAMTHLRQMGSSYRSVFHGRMRWGRGQYFMGTHPLYLLFVGLYRMAERPWVLGGLCIVWGYAKAWAQARRGTATGRSAGTCIGGSWGSCSGGSRRRCGKPYESTPPFSRDAEALRSGARRVRGAWIPSKALASARALRCAKPPRRG